MTLSKEEYDMMFHAIGHLKSKKGGRVKTKSSSCFRNYFAADPEGCQIWENLVKKGFSKIIGKPNEIFEYKTYVLTEQGFKELLKYRKENNIKGYA